MYKKKPQMIKFTKCGREITLFTKALFLRPLHEDDAE